MRTLVVGFEKDVALRGIPKLLSHNPELDITGILARRIDPKVLSTYDQFPFFEKKVDEEFLINLEFEGEISDEVIRHLNHFEEHIFYNINRYFDTGLGYDYTLLRFKIICYALKILNTTKPELVFFTATPHDPVSYVLYLLAQLAKKQVVLFNLAGAVQAFYLYKSIGDQATFVKASPQKQEKDRLKECKTHMLARIEEFRGEDPWFMQIQKKRYGSIFKKAYHSLFVRKKASIQGLKGYLFKKGQRKVYEEFCEIKSAGDIAALNAPTVYFPMHLQPELTTSPDGGEWSQHWLVVQRVVELTKATGAYVMVKEHPSQFLVNSKTVRTSVLYKALLKISDKVKLVSLDVASRDLLDAASSVATITGTIALETVIAAKPVLAFGDAKVLGLKGVFDIRKKSDVIEFLAYHKGEKSLNYEEIKDDLIDLSASQYYYPYYKEKVREDQEMEATASLLSSYLENEEKGLNAILD